MPAHRLWMKSGASGRAANLKKEAAKRPKKIQRYSMMMLFCIVIIYLVVLSTEVLGSLGAFFG